MIFIKNYIHNNILVNLFKSDFFLLHSSKVYLSEFKTKPKQEICF